MAATRGDWETTPLPAARALIKLDRVYTTAELARIQEGNVPEAMEDKWFTFYEEPWLYLHRSWTGIGIFQVRFEPTAGGARMSEVWVNRDPSEYPATDAASDALLLAALLDRYAGRDATEAWDQFLASLRSANQDG